MDVPMPQEILNLLELAPGMHMAFLIIEGKSHKRSVAEAQNQARRAGATLVNGARKLKRRVDDALVEASIDQDTFVFSATFSTEALQIFVHWYDATNGLYHMNRVSAVTLNDRDQIISGRRQLHNILEWGADVRFWQHRSLRTKIAEFATREFEKRSEDGNKKRKLGSTTISSAESLAN